ncbi:MAG: site-specific integrase [Marinilabiliaceae bacterium]|nr:site-specific integrase [Marinilabiliaceae bacterium]
MNDSQTFGVQFVIRHKSKKSQMAGIYLRLTVNGQRIEISTKLFCPVYLWDKKKERVKADKDYSNRQINAHIDENRAKINSIYQELRMRDEMITVNTIKNHFLGIKEEGHTLQKLIDYHYRTQEHTLNPATLKHYKSTHRYLKLFLANNKSSEDIFLNQINYSFLTDFEAYLRSYQPTESGQRPLCHNTVMKHMCRFRTLMNLAIKLSWMTHYPFKAYKLSYKQANRGFLTKEELNHIENKEFKMERLQLTKDLFIFSCYTGLAYIDISLLQPNHITIGIDGNNWLYTQRKKTENPVRIPLLPKAEYLINKYREHPRSLHYNTLFPRISNQKLNGYLKEIADICGIDKNLTFHMARHTFATTVTLSNGVPIETVSKILGHTKISTTQIYAKVVENKVSEDMLQLQLKLEKVKPKNNKKAN